MYSRIKKSSMNKLVLSCSCWHVGIDESETGRCVCWVFSFRKNIIIKRFTALYDR